MSRRCELPPGVESPGGNSSSTNCTICRGLEFSLHCIRWMKIPALVFLILCSYLLITVTIYEVKNWRRSKRTFIRKLYIVPVYLGTMCSVLVFTSIQGYLPPAVCGVHSASVFCSYSLSVMAVHTVFWARQRRFYRDPLFHETQNALMNFLSKYTIVGVYFGGGGVAAFLSTQVCFAYYKGYCAVPMSRAYKRLSLISIAITSLLVKAVLLALTLHPLLHEHQSVCECRKPESASYLRRRREVRNLMVRLFLCIFVTFLTTLICCIIFLLGSEEGFCVGWDILCLASVWITNVATLFTYADGRLRLNPVLALRNKPRNREVSLSLS